MAILPKHSPPPTITLFPKVRIEKKNIQNVVSLKTATVITRLWVTINAS